MRSSSPDRLGRGGTVKRVMRSDAEPEEHAAMRSGNMETMPKLMEAMTVEERAVASVIYAESVSFFAKDFQTFARTWAHSPPIRRLGWWTRGGVSDVWGWQELADLTRQMMEESPKRNETADQLLYENFVIRVSGDLAYATFDQFGIDAGEPGIDMPGRSRESRVLARVDGAWCIIYHTYVHQTTEPQRVPMIRVDKDAHVSWLNSGAEKALKDAASGLRMLAGRLVATDERNNRRLKTAIAEASARDTTLDGGRAAVPIVLDLGDDSEVVRVCWVLTEGSGAGAVLVSLNNLTFAQEQLQAASLVFGLSPAQERIVEQLASGHDLQAAAGHLGISVNTVRTQLQRIFDKTGARSQTALIRTMMSVERPA